MPAKPTWHKRLPQILAALEASSETVLDRLMIERQFQIGERQAQTLLRQWGAYRAGGSWLLNRLTLIERLHALVEGREYTAELERQERLRQQLAERQSLAAAAHETFAVDPRVRKYKQADLPRAFELIAPGKLQLTFHGYEDFWSQIAALAAIGKNDGQRLRAFVEGWNDSDGEP